MSAARADRAVLRAIGLARAAFGAVFLARTTPVLAPVAPALAARAWPLLGWPDAAWHAPVLGLRLPPAVVALLCVARTAGAVGLMLGVRSSLCGLVAGVAGYLVLAQDAFGYFHHLHMLFLGAILFACVDADGAIALRPATARSPRSSAWLLRAWVASIYAWAAVAKLRPDWLDGRALALFHAEGALHGALADAVLASPHRRAAVACTVVLVEALLGPALLWPRSRRVALVVALALHAGFELVGRVDTIGWQMAALLLVFLPRDGPARSLRRAARGGGRPHDQ